VIVTVDTPAPFTELSNDVTLCPTTRRAGAPGQTMCEGGGMANATIIERLG
jgi:hypothetical protein